MPVDAIVVGSGPNGLVAANRLADAGWSVLVIEQQPEIGGAVRHDGEVHPDFVHDTFSSFYPLAAVSPTMRSLDLERWGVRWRHAPAVLGHCFDDGQWAVQDRDRDATADRFEAEHRGDGEAWLRLCAMWDRLGEELVGALFGPFPPVRRGLALARALPGTGGMQAARMMLLPVTELARTHFGGRGPAALLAGNAAHADIPLDAPGSGLMGLLMTMLGQTVGFPVPAGGAGHLTQALARRLEAADGRIVRGTGVEAIEVEGRRVTGVRLTDGSRLAARRVLADVSAPALYRRLLPPSSVPARVRRAMATFAWDPGTIKVDWALDGGVPWRTSPVAAPGTVHIADSLAEMSTATAQVGAGVVPAAPFLLAGQMTTTDPERSPPGTESLWAYTHVPQRVLRDAGGDLTGVWDAHELEQFADRMQERIEARAPGFGDRVLARRVLGPRELEARNANLVGGAIGGGTQQLHQQLVFRPVPGLGRAETGIRGLYLASSSAHPGGGAHGTPGDNAAWAALFHARLGR
ncbi:NAD(P)/FAD-dependent oxidoreductase [Aeromicrobium sp. PE09-221]|uniref:phytoene desaturase family protein n=1 Tax=Aeromicrobium sp. PE09-221 TaxID=1898043 RepID=UPI001F3773D4|nr:NAD(P)/FAD-dependent oxidoreductase [Aeromicrobium sp. PE09-221]